ncbi:MAG: FAD-dependent oxidoreductase, partial [Myxococcota bacterium]|nr:FAD-dependent oxidoreductase [Myxococcota bacterium]
DHHWSRPALMYIYMGHMRFQDTKPYEDHFWSRNRIQRVRGWVQRVDTAAKMLAFTDGRTLSYDVLVLATGSVANRWGWPGQDLERVHGMISLQDLISLEHMTRRLRHAVIVGGGLIGIELAEMLRSRRIPTTILVREALYWGDVLPAGEAAMVVRAIRRAGIGLRLETELTEIHDDGHGGAGGVTTSTAERIDCQFVGLTAGVRPNLAAVQDSDIRTRTGILVDEQLRTSATDVFAVGDCAEVVTAEGDAFIQQAWYTGKAQGELVAGNVLGGNARYLRGIWFNSAKFLDIEYQTYGRVPNQPDGEHGHLYWEHPGGRKSMRLVHRDGTFVGANVMGMRLRHRVCEAWIKEACPVEHVVEHLHQAMFDPELEATPLPAIRRAFAGSHP